MTATRHNHRTSCRRRGYTLIELLVAMTIALFLLGGLLTIVQSTRQAFTTQGEMSQLQDSERLAMTLMGDVIQAAGYFPDPQINTSSALPLDGAFTAGQAMTGTTGAAAPGDSISVRFMTDNGQPILNCTGGTNTTGAAVTYTNTFSVDAAGNLSCTLSVNGAASAPVVLIGPQAGGIGGVQNLQIWYGVNTSGGDANVDTFMTATQVTAANDWDDVTCVKIRLTFFNPLAAQQPGQPNTNYIERVVGVMSRTGVTT
ncbi:MAG: PilW family protein [Steroidobacteraceae bacterium]